MVRKRDEGKTWLSWVIQNIVWRRGFIGRGSGRKDGKKGREIRAGRMGGKKGREETGGGGGKGGKKGRETFGGKNGGNILEGFLLWHKSEITIQCYINA